MVAVNSAGGGGGSQPITSYVHNSTVESTSELTLEYTVFMYIQGIENEVCKHTSITTKTVSPNTPMAGMMNCMSTATTPSDQEVDRGGLCKQVVSISYFVSVMY